MSTPAPAPPAVDWKLSRCVHCGEVDCICPEPDGSDER